MAESAILARAARMSSSATGLTVICMAGASQFDPYTLALFDGFVVDVMGRGHVFDGKTQRLEQRDLLRRLAAFDPADQDLADFATHVIVANRAFLLRYQEVARLVKRRFTPIHEQARFDNRRRVEFAGVRHARSDRV